MTFSNPYNDDNMTYDSIFHRYILTINIAKQYVGNAYADDGILSRRLKEISQNVYDYIYTRGNTNNKKYTRAILNATANGRNLIMEVMLAQLSADSQNGYNDIVKQNTIDFTNGNVIDRNKIIENQVCVACQTLIENSSADLDGYQIVCQMSYYIPQIENIIGSLAL